MLPTAARRLGSATAILLLITGTVSAQTTYRWIDPKSGGTSTRKVAAPLSPTCRRHREPDRS